MNIALHQRITDYFAKRRIVVEEKKMFGGRVFLLHGNMCAGISAQGELMVRLATSELSEYAKHKGFQPTDEKARRMGGLLIIRPEGFHQEKDLAFWLDHSYDYVSMLPAKSSKKKMDASA